MAVAEKVGVDRRGNTLYKRSPDGEIILEEQEERERIRINGKNHFATLKRKVPIVDNDLPEIARAYHEFRKQYPEPGGASEGSQRVISRIEAYRYRCFSKLAVSLERTTCLPAPMARGRQRCWIFLCCLGISLLRECAARLPGKPAFAWLFRERIP